MAGKRTTVRTGKAARPSGRDDAAAGEVLMYLLFSGVLERPRGKVLLDAPRVKKARNGAKG